MIRGVGVPSYANVLAVNNAVDRWLFHLLVRMVSMNVAGDGNLVGAFSGRKGNERKGFPLFFTSAVSSASARLETASLETASLDVCTPTFPGAVFCSAACNAEVK